MLKRILQSANISPKNIFLVDSIGAIASAAFLIVLVIWEDYFGMPKTILYSLVFVAFSFAAYSFCCYKFVRKKWDIFLKIIATANGIYAISTFVLVLNHFHELTLLGVVYFLSEIIVIVLLVLLELNVATKSFVD